MGWYDQVFTSPDGLYRVHIDASEMRMSHTVFSPVLTHIPTGEVVFSLAGTLWDADASFDSEGRLSMSLRRYPGDRPSHNAVIDLRSGQVTMTFDGVPSRSVTPEEFRRLHSPEAGDEIWIGVPQPVPPPVAKRRDPLQMAGLALCGLVLLGVGTLAIRAWTPVGTLGEGGDWVVALFGAGFGLMLIGLAVYPPLSHR